MKQFLLLSIFLYTSVFAQDIKVVAHRGGVNWGPENTLATFEIAISKGVDYIEMDVRQTNDGVFILMHDKTISRTTNGSGSVAAMNWDQLKELDAGSWYNESFAGEQIPTLKDVLKVIDGRVLPDIDFKSGNPKELIELLDELGYLDGRLLTLYSGNHNVLKTIKDLTDKIVIRPSLKNSYEEMVDSLNPSLVNLSFKKFKKNQAKIVDDEKKCFVNCLFTANRKRAIKKAIKLEADFIQTDKLDFLLNQLKLTASNKLN